MKYHRNSRCYRESSGSALYADAERLLKRRMGELASGKFAGLAIERIRMQELFDDLVEEYRINQRASIVHLRSRLRLHVIPAFGSIRAAELSTTQVKVYTAKRLQAGAANAPINRELEAVERALKLATQCDPPKLVRQIHIPMLQENNVRTGFLEDAGYLRLRAELPDYLKPLLVIGYHVGTRLGGTAQASLVRSGFRERSDPAQAGQHQEQEGPHSADLWAHAPVPGDAEVHPGREVPGVWAGVRP